MICDNCRKAGRLNAQANQIGAEPGTIMLHGMAGKMHLTCADRMCTCQHVTGRVLNPEFVSRDQ